MNKSLTISSLVSWEIRCELKSLGFNTLSAGFSKNIFNETAYHPDILFFKLNGNKLLTEKNYALVNNLDIFLDKIESRAELRNNYPYDCIFNCFVADRCLICGKSVAPEIIEYAEAEGLEVVFVKQGYAACSTVKVKSNAYISSDVGITKALISRGYDALYVNNDGILLSGYTNGFIGGCCLAQTNEYVAFSGNIEAHKSFDSIKSFCKNHNVVPYSLSKSQLYDYGGHIALN